MILWRLKTWAPIGAGLFLFLTPFTIDGQFFLPIAWLSKALQQILAPVMSWLVPLLVLVAGGGGLWRSGPVARLLGHSWGWVLIRFCGALFATVYFFGLGPELFQSSDVGGLLYNDLMPLLLCLFALAGLALPLLLDYGLVELMGTVLGPLMRPLFKLPGRSAIDCLSSWLGDGSLGIMVTARQYKEGHYTMKEASIIATTFSLVSLTFTLVVVAQLDLNHRFGLFYFLVCLCGLACALILPRIPPLSMKPDLLIDGRAPEREVSSPEQSLLKAAYQKAMERRAQAPGPKEFFSQGLKQSAQMVLGLLPVISTLGAIALLLAEGTSFFAILGLPFTWLFDWVNLEEGALAGQAVVVGLADMFLPALLASSIENETTRLVVGVLSVSQLIYFSEVGGLILASGLPLKLWELVVLFFLRTFISLSILLVFFALF